MSEYIQVGEYNDNWLCICKNTSHSSGFYACTKEGVDMIEEGGWPLEGWDVKHYKCGSCHRVIDQSSFEPDPSSTDPEYPNRAKVVHHRI